MPSNPPRSGLSGKMAQAALALAALAGVSPAALATETYNPATNTLAISDLRVGGGSYAVTLAVQPQPNNQGYYYANITGLSPNNTCTRGLYKNAASGSFYYVNTYTQNGIEVGGVQVAKATKIGSDANARWIFLAAWTSQAPTANPLLKGYSGAASLPAGSYGLAGYSKYSGFSNGDPISVQGNPGQGYSITDLQTRQVLVLTPVTGTTVAQLPCPAASGTYVGLSSSNYQVTIYGSGAGSLTPASASDLPYTATWNNWQGALATIVDQSTASGAAGITIGVLDLGQSALALYLISPDSQAAADVLIFNKQD